MSHFELEKAYWYAARQATQGEDMMREYPSSPPEAWESAVDGAYYARQISQARLEKRIGFVPYDETIPVYSGSTSKTPKFQSRRSGFESAKRRRSSST